MRSARCPRCALFSTIISSHCVRLSLLMSSPLPRKNAVEDHAGIQQERLKPEDCLACRVIGTAALGGVGVYALQQSRAHAPGSVVGKRIMAGVGVCEYALDCGIIARLTLPGFLVASALRWSK